MSGWVSWKGTQKWHPDYFLFCWYCHQKLGPLFHYLHCIKCDNFVGFTHGTSSNQTLEFVYSVILKFCLCLNQLSSCRIYEKRRKSNHSVWKSDLKNPSIFPNSLGLWYVPTWLEVMVGLIWNSYLWTCKCCWGQILLNAMRNFIPLQQKPGLYWVDVHCWCVRPQCGLKMPETLLGWLAVGRIQSLVFSL